MYHDAGVAVADRGLTQTEVDSDVDTDLQQVLSRNIAELDLSVRANNCLESAKIGTVGELVSFAESDLLKVRSFGKTSLMEVKRKLSDLGLSLGMDLSQRSVAPEEPDEPMPENPQMAEEPAGMNN